jgi:uncharacterized phage infection (PIP) family protein YhgE
MKTMYLTNGQQVIMDKEVVDENGKILYVVIPLWKGTMYRFYDAGGEHGEVSIDYEHEGDPIVVEKIFEIPPVEKLDKTIEEKESLIKKLVESIGSLSLLEKEKSNNIKKLETSVITQEQLINNKKTQLEKVKDEIQKAKEELNCIILEKEKETEKLADYQRKVAHIAVKHASLKTEDEAKNYISSERLKYLEDRNYKLSLLEQGGVDNWSHYEDALSELKVVKNGVL